MKREGRRALPAGAQKVREGVEHWRRTRTKRSPMPEHLWDAAVALAQAHGLYRISQGLRVNYDSLKARMARAPKAKPKPKPARRKPSRNRATSFVELAAASPVASAPSGGAVVELVDAKGTKLTIRLAAGVAVDVAAVMRAFRGRRR